MKKFLVLLCWVSVVFSSASFAAPLDEAKALFDRYVQLGDAFDAAAADLYADDAIIKNKRAYPNGQVREITIPAPQYKELIRRVMPLAKASGDTNTYSDVRFTQEGTGVRVRAIRFSNLKKYSSPISLLLAPDVSGQWLIREELSESQP